MTETMQRTPQFQRFLNFVDAIVAIAITLLVLPLAELAKQDYTTAWTLVKDNAIDIVAFVISFAVILQLWWTQHKLLYDIEDGDRRIIRALVLWVFTVVVLPFSTSLATYDDGTDPSARVLYIGAMTASAVALAYLAWAVSRQGSIGHRALPALAEPIMLLIAMTLTVGIPQLGYWPMLLFFLPNPVSTLVRRVLSR